MYVIQHSFCSCQGRFFALIPRMEVVRINQFPRMGKGKYFCGNIAWNMLEYVMLWCSVSCVPLCKGVRCARLCTLFFKSLLFDLYLVYHIFMWLSTKTFELTIMWVCSALHFIVSFFVLLSSCYHTFMCLSRTF